MNKWEGVSDNVFRWSLQDVFNQSLFKVEKIHESFDSIKKYFDSYKDPLLEETRAELCSSMEMISSAPFAEVTSFLECKTHGSLVYDVKVDHWKNKSGSHRKEHYRTLPGDIVILANAKPETVSDLQRTGRTWTFALVKNISDDATTSTQFKVEAAKEVEVSDGMWNSLFVIFLMNITPNRRMWSALHMQKNLDLIKEVLSPDYMATDNYGGHYMNRSQIWDENMTSLLSTLNESQSDALLACLQKKIFNDKPYVELIWGPPGTGKTKTVSVLLYILLRMQRRTLTCAPTNVAITEVATRVLKLVRESHASLYSVGDILLFGNKERLKGNSEVTEIYLEYRVERLEECFAPMTGWQIRINSTIGFFEDCVSPYYVFLEEDLHREIENTEEHISRKHKSFLEFARERFMSSVMPLKECVLTLCTHIPESYIGKHNIANVVSLVRLIDKFGSLLFRDDVTSEALQESLSDPELVLDSSRSFRDAQIKLRLSRRECLYLLKNLHKSLNALQLPSAMNKHSIEKFCFERASLILCTASSSYELHLRKLEPLDILVIDEAAQLKECESMIPLQLCGINHVILMGDECQLPAMVESNFSSEAGFARSLFERLSSLGHPKHLLNMQYRMHPSISHFPNAKFYLNNMLDAPNVMSKSYTKKYLSGPMFGPYSFINVFGGNEEKYDVGHSRPNTVEVAIISKLLKSLYKAWNSSKENISIGVISPCAAQVTAIQEKLDQKFEICGFSVKVGSVDGFQGGEEDIIIISTARENRGGATGLMSNYQRINELAKSILEVKKEFDQLDDLLNGESVFFRNCRWKVLFSENFRRSFGKLASVQTKTTALNYILRLSGGWRPKKRNADVISESFQFLRQFKVAGLYVICSVDIVKEKRYTQVLKVWDILPLDDVQKLIRSLNGIFDRYADDFISHCNEKCLEGDSEIRITWSCSTDIIRYKSLGDDEPGSNLNSDDKSYVENSKVSDSLLLMKFYNLSSVVVSHLLSGGDGRELELPFELTDEEMEIIFYERSTFILGRSGTGKTTVLTMKLFKKEQLYLLANERHNGDCGASFNYELSKTNARDDKGEMVEPVEDAENSVLRQLFVTVSPKLCFAVKQQVAQLKSFVSGGKYSACNSSVDREDVENAAGFEDIPDSFVGIPPKAYPLVITFNKFIMMLDGTIGTSYFERFPDMRQILFDKLRNFSGSIIVQTFLKTREVNFEKFCSMYWPHFNSRLTTKLDFSRVFIEIMSRIKGGLQARESSDGRLTREDYVVLAESRTSTLNKHEREMIYDAYEDYEKMKMENGEFDMADIVIDLHRRLRDKNYGGDMMDSVYIDEVQDLTMSQVALFKHISKNVKEGFVFSGDTAQTIARGIDFRFEDIRSLFYNHFIMGCRTEGNGRMKDKGLISKIFHLSQNFHTHAGVLKLAQSVIDLLYRFFPTFVDILSHETSLIFGEAPILLESGNDENAIVTIFGNHGNLGSKFVGFGAEQVILVRDDNARKEIAKYVGKQALVLTIVECKGLEFQDVLLYNFFGTSLLRNKWRVLYEYMGEQCLLDASTGQSFPSFNPSKFNSLCSELKQLYVAVTRTRQRLWICENSEEFSKPMFDYWRKKGLVQVRKLDDSLATSMQVVSSPEEWKSQGYKLLHERNYEMATMCFERAGDEYGEKLAKAAGLKAAADNMHALNPEMASIARRQAGEIFESIGKDEYAAECFFLLKEYERAGKSYLKCGESSMERAVKEDSLRKGCIMFSENADTCTLKRSNELDRTEQEFLDRCALHYHELKDNRTMMKYVRAFNCVASIRDFLEKLGCVDELLSFEEESGNFLEAAKVAKMKGELLHEADLVAEAGNPKDASLLILWVHKSTRGQILSARKILDAHLIFNNSKYGWEDHMIHDLARFSEGEISKNQVSAETLVHFWDFWKNSIVNIFEYLRSPDVSDVENCGDFCLNYMGVRRQFNGLNPIYNLMIPDANWANELDSRSTRSNEKFISLNVHQFASAAQSYWSSEVLSVVAKFLLDSKFLDRQYHVDKALQKFVKLPTQHLFSCLFPLDLKESLKENMISLRRTEHIGNLVKEVTCEAAAFKKRISYEQFGRILVAIFGSSKLDCQLFEKIKDGLRWNPSWMALIVEICKEKDNKSVAPDEQTLMWALHGVLQDIYSVNWRKAKDYFSPECFLYLVERQLNLLSCIQGNFYTTKSSFCEMLVHMEHDGTSISWIKKRDTVRANAILQLLVRIVYQFLLCNNDTKEWTEWSHANAAVTLRFVATAFLLYLNFGCYREYLFDWLGRKNISSQLPREFIHALNIRRKRLFWNVALDSDMPSENDYELTVSADIHMLSETFKKIGNPLVLTSLGGGHGGKWCSPCTIFLDMINQSKEDMWTALFPNTTQDHKKPVELDAADSCNMLGSLDLHDLQESSPLDEDRFPSNYGQLREMLKSLQSMNIAGDMDSFVASIPDFKASVGKSICIFTSALRGCYDSDTKNGKPYEEASMMLDELKQLYCALHMKGMELVINIPKIGALLRDIQSKMPRIVDSQLDVVFLEQDEILKVVSGTCHLHEQEGTSDVARSGSSSLANLGDQAKNCQAGNKEKGTSKTRKKPKGKRKGKK
ncbi:P-loop containing nucleoside triphosphate hydrolases superfamily protein [Euphorbia peplus]|nr:P-loop containing nucleoside triphosphate hydrolases superfamily protein [Euphorbia peplus]